MMFITDTLAYLRRSTIDVLESLGINKPSKYSPEVPSDLSKDMPDLFERLPLMLPWDKAQPVDPSQHTVWILDNTAFQRSKLSRHSRHLPRPRRRSRPTAVNANGDEVIVRKRDETGWQAEFIVCYFVKDSGADVSYVIAAIARMLHIEEKDIATRQRIADRVQPFADTVLVKRTLRVDIGSQEQVTLGPSSYNGISADIVPLHLDLPASTPVLTIPTTPPDSRSIAGRTLAYPPTGWLIISDIDDTIKITLTPSPLGVLHSTFIAADPLPVPDMPALYTTLNTTLSSPPFFYLSASPYPLYPFLRPFLSTHYPPGTLLLRDASWQNLGGLIASLTQGVEAYKVSQMRKIHAWFPGRKVLCIGDSTQRDPESYAAVAREFPGWVKGVFVRKVTGVEGMDEEVKNSEKRFKAAFKGLEGKGVVCRVFEKADEVKEMVDEVVRMDVDRGA